MYVYTYVYIVIKNGMKYTYVFVNQSRSVHAAWSWEVRVISREIIDVQIMHEKVSEKHYL